MNNKKVIMLNGILKKMLTCCKKRSIVKIIEEKCNKEKCYLFKTNRLRFSMIFVANLP